MHCTHSRRLLPRVRGDGTSNSGVDLQRVRSTAMLEASVNVVPSCLRSLLRTSLHRVRGARRGLDHPAAVGYGRHNIIQHAREPREHAVISVVTRRRSTSNRSAWNTWNENMKPSCMLVLDPLPYLTHLPEEIRRKQPGWAFLLTHSAPSLLGLLAKIKVISLISDTFPTGELRY